jgi:hypothetical protein
VVNATFTLRPYRESKRMKATFSRPDIGTIALSCTVAVLLGTILLAVAVF